MQCGRAEWRCFRVRVRVTELGRIALGLIPYSCLHIGYRLRLRLRLRVSRVRVRIGCSATVRLQPIPLP